MYICELVHQKKTTINLVTDVKLCHLLLLNISEIIMWVNTEKSTLQRKTIYTTKNLFLIAKAIDAKTDPGVCTVE